LLLQLLLRSKTPKNEETLATLKKKMGMSEATELQVFFNAATKKEEGGKNSKKKGKKTPLAIDDAKNDDDDDEEHPDCCCTEDEGDDDEEGKDKGKKKKGSALDKKIDALVEASTSLQGVKPKAIGGKCSSMLKAVNAIKSQLEVFNIGKHSSQQHKTLSALDSSALVLKKLMGKKTLKVEDAKDSLMEAAKTINTAKSLMKD